MNIFKRVKKLEIELKQLTCEHPLNRLYFKTYLTRFKYPYGFSIYEWVCQDCGKIIESSTDKDNIKEWHKKKNDYMAEYHMKIAEKYKNGEFDD